MVVISQPFAYENEQPTPLVPVASRLAFDAALHSMRPQNSCIHVTSARYVLWEPISRTYRAHTRRFGSFGVERSSAHVPNIILSPSPSARGLLSQRSVSV